DQLSHVDLPAPDLLVPKNSEVSTVEWREGKQVQRSDEDVERRDERQEAREIPSSQQSTCRPGNAHDGRRVRGRALRRSGGFRKEAPDRGGTEELAECLEAEPCTSPDLAAAGPERRDRVVS